MDRAYSLLRRYIVATLALGAVATVPFWIYMPTLVRWVYKTKYVSATNAFRVMLLVAVVQLIFGWAKTFPVSIGRPGLRTFGQTLEIVTLVPGVLILGYFWGATGAACGVLAGSLVLGAFWTVALVGLRRGVAA